MLTRLSISAKLFAIVSFLFLVIATIGGIALLQMRAINTAAQDIQAQWLPSVRWVGEMRVQSARFRAVLRGGQWRSGWLDIRYVGSEF